MPSNSTRHAQPQPTGRLRNFHVPLQHIRKLLKQDYSLYEECLRNIVEATTRRDDASAWLAQIEQVVESNEAVYFSHQGVLFLLGEIMRSETIKTTVNNTPPHPLRHSSPHQSMLSSSSEPAVQPPEDVAPKPAQSGPTVPATLSSISAISIPMTSTTPISPPKVTPSSARESSPQIQNGTNTEQRIPQNANNIPPQPNIKEEHFSDMLVSQEGFGLSLPPPDLPEPSNWVHILDPGQPLRYEFKPRQPILPTSLKPESRDVVLFSDPDFKDEVRQFFNAGVISQDVTKPKATGKTRKKVTFDLGTGQPPIPLYDPASDDLKEWKDCVKESGGEIEVEAGGPTVRDQWSDYWDTYRRARRAMTD